MKKLLGLAVAMMLGMSIVGCESTSEETSEVKAPETKQEEQIEVEEIEETEEVEVKEEPVEEVEVFDYDELNYYMTTNLPEEEYDRYFNSLRKIENGNFVYQEVEFDGSIDFVDLREGYDTRYELGMSTGDYSETEFNGPFIKVKDIAGTELGGLVFGKCNVRVKAKIDKYDMEHGWLVIDIIEIEAR